MYQQISERIRTFFFGGNGGKVNNESLAEYASLISDVWFNYGIDQTVKLHVAQSTGKTYYLRFSVEALFNIMRWLTYAPNLSLPGATHADDIFYLFGTEGPLSDFYNSVDENSLERRVIAQLSKIYTNFMVYGNPVANDNSIIFHEVSEDVLHFLDVTNEGFIAGVEPNGDNMHFWDNLIEEFNLW